MTDNRQPPATVFNDAVTLDPELVRWATMKALAHEHDWGFDDDVNIAGPLCGWRGAVGMHTDFDFPRDEWVAGLILVAEVPFPQMGNHALVYDAGEGTIVAGRLDAGTVYVLDPAVKHGTKDGMAGLLLFGAITFDPREPWTPDTLGRRVVDALESERDLYAAKPNPYEGCDPMTRALIEETHK